MSWRVAKDALPWPRFVTTRPAGRPVRSPLTVERVDRDSAIDFATIVCGAFGLRTVSIPLIAALASDDRWQLFLSRDGDVCYKRKGEKIQANKQTKKA